MYQHGLIGGTFDRVHAGHLRLISEAIDNCEFLEIWITNDKIAQRKDWRCWTEEKRRSEIAEKLTLKQNEKIIFGSLEDNYGPATEHPTADVIFCTSETKSSCDQINEIRINKGMKPLEIIIVQHAKSENGGTISSSKIREGLIDREGREYLSEETLKYSRHITKDVQLLLKEPFGVLHTGPEEDPTIALKSAVESMNGKESLVSVGDVTTWALMEIGRTPDIAVIDGMTKRSPWARANEIDRSRYDKVIQVHNPPGSITSDLIHACESAVVQLRLGRKTVVIVDGEEDLAPIPLHLSLPLGAVVMYGQPKKGVVARVTDLNAKKNCLEILSSMKREGGH
ncbi:MAG: pantetheine-phosphate adenylyltransferase [Candidatus Thalassarchaeaceae archaeon]